MVLRRIYTGIEVEGLWKRKTKKEMMKQYGQSINYLIENEWTTSIDGKSIKRQQASELYNNR